MADDGSKQGAAWPMPKFRFEVDLGTVIKGVFRTGLAEVRELVFRPPGTDDD